SHEEPDGGPEPASGSGPKDADDVRREPGVGAFGKHRCDAPEKTDRVVPQGFLQSGAFLLAVPETEVAPDMRHLDDLRLVHGGTGPQERQAHALDIVTAEVLAVEEPVQQPLPSGE